MEKLKECMYFFKNASLQFTSCFRPFTGRSQKTKSVRVALSGSWEAKMDAWHFGRSGKAHLGKAGALFVSFVQRAMECQVSVNEVFCAAFLERYDGVCHVCSARKTGSSCPLRQAQRGRDLLVAHASDCHLFSGEELVCGKDHFARKVLVNSVDLWQMRMWCTDMVSGVSDVCVGVQCGKTCGFIINVEVWALFIKKGPTLEKTCRFWTSLVHSTIPREKKSLVPRNNKENRRPKTQEAQS